jgi:hypothetical protein
MVDYHREASAFRNRTPSREELSRNGYLCSISSGRSGREKLGVRCFTLVAVTTEIVPSGFDGARYEREVSVPVEFLHETTPSVVMDLILEKGWRYLANIARAREEVWLELVG